MSEWLYVKGFTTSEKISMKKACNSVFSREEFSLYPNGQFFDLSVRDGLIDKVYALKK